MSCVGVGVGRKRGHTPVVASRKHGQGVWCAVEGQSRGAATVEACDAHMALTRRRRHVAEHAAVSCVRARPVAQCHAACMYVVVPKCATCMDIHIQAPEGPLLNTRAHGSGSSVAPGVTSLSPPPGTQAQPLSNRAPVQHMPNRQQQQQQLAASAHVSWKVATFLPSTYRPSLLPSTWPFHVLCTESYLNM